MWRERERIQSSGLSLSLVCGKWGVVVIFACVNDCSLWFSPRASFEADRFDPFPDFPSEFLLGIPLRVFFFGKPLRKRPPPPSRDSVAVLLMLSMLPLPSYSSLAWPAASRQTE